MQRPNRITNATARWFRKEGDPAPPADPPPADPSPTPPAPGEGESGAPPAKPEGTPPADTPMVPKARMDEVLAQRDALAAEKAERERTEAKERGDWETMATQEKERGDAAVSAAQGLARRTAFLEAATAAGLKAGVALKLAIADGLLDTIPVDKEYRADGDKAQEAVEVLIKDPDAKAAVKPASTSFGDDASGQGNGSGPTPDPNKMDPIGRLAAGMRGTAKR